MTTETEYMRHEQQELETTMVKFMTNGNCMSMDDLCEALQRQIRYTIDYLCKMEKMLYKNAIRLANADTINSIKANEITRDSYKRLVSNYLATNIGCTCEFSDNVTDIQIRLQLKNAATGWFSNIKNSDTSGVIWVYE